MKKKKSRYDPPLLPPERRSIPQSLVSLMFFAMSIMLLWLVIAGIDAGYLHWPGKSGPVRTTYRSAQPGLFWICAGLHVAGVVATALAGRALWRLAGPTPPPAPPRPKRPTDDAAQYRKKKSP